jgi:lipid-A-disaccharide synthase
VRVALVAGELSGDALGAGLIREIRARVPGAVFEGVAGPAMRDAGCHALHDADELAVMGLTEVLRHLPRLLRLRRGLVRRWREDPPDVFVGIDAPDFNIGLARRLRRRGIRTVQYVSPSVWAWRRRRVRKIAKACDRVLCLLPFEKRFYDEHGVAADFVGHPLAEVIQWPVNQRELRAAFGLDPDAPVLAVLPGSRAGEVTRLGPDFAAAARELGARIPGLQVIAPMAGEKTAALFRQQAATAGLTGDAVRIVVGGARDAMGAADVVLLASGTATLEATLLRRPMVVAYRLAPSTYRIVKALRLVKVRHFSLPNLLSGEPLIPEIVQEDVTPARLADELESLLGDTERAAAISAEFAKIHGRLARDANRLAAAAVVATAAAHNSESG